MLHNLRPRVVGNKKVNVVPGLKMHFLVFWYFTVLLQNK